MKNGYLSDYFTGVGSKILTRVDATPQSNQHEVGDGQRGDVLKRILGAEPRKKNNRFHARYLWLGDEQETVSDEGFLSWYDTREKQPHRGPEWRLYYQTNAVTEMMEEDDRLIVARQKNDTLLFIVVPEHSSITSNLLWLFGLEVQRSFDGFSVNPIEDGDNTKLDFLARFILDEIGVEFEDPNANTIDTIIDRFGNIFPRTREFSDLARLTLPDVDAREDADFALLAWLDHEEAMFRRLEKRIVSRDIRKGWVKDDNEVDVDAFIRYSLGVQNRRKSRMGHSFENHLKAVFDANELQYESQVVTEKGKKPDFVFPGKKQYFDSDFETNLLTMLAAKSSCKDRWPQILPEAERISRKHLVTLERGMSLAQTDLMQKSDVQLIVPENIKTSYTGPQQEWIWNISDFVASVAEKQTKFA